MFLIAITKLKFTIDPTDERPNNPHSQSIASDRIESFRQNRPVIGDRQRVALSGIGFQGDLNPACAVFDGVRDQFVCDEAERNADNSRQLNFNSLNDDGPLCALRGKHEGEIATKVLKVLLEREGLYSVQ